MGSNVFEIGTPSSAILGMESQIRSLKSSLGHLEHVYKIYQELDKMSLCIGRDEGDSVFGDNPEIC